MQNNWDLVILGGGPSGLATALGARTHDVEKVLVLEQNSGIGFRLIGQSIHYKPDLLKKIFHEHLPTRSFVTDIKSYNRRYYSPSGKNSFHLEDKTERVWLDFRLFLEDLAKQAVLKDIMIRPSSKVIEIKSGKKSGHTLTILDNQTNNIFNVNAELIVGADGANSFTAKTMGLPSPSPICPIIASQFFGVYEEDTMEFFFYSDYENKVAATSYIFPHGKEVAEFGVILFADVSQTHLSNHWDLWEAIMKSPIIKDKINPLRFYNTLSSAIPMGAPVTKLFANKTFIIGEAAGHVTSSGGSGILTGLELGHFLGEEIGKIYPNWGESSLIEVESKILNHPTHEKLTLLSQIIIPYRKWLFRELGSWEKIDQAWNEIEETLSLVFGVK